MAVHPRPAGLRPGAARRRERAVAVAGELSGRSEAELIAHVLGGADPTAEARRWSHEVARLPAWRRRSLGAAGLVAEHGVAAEPALRLAALWELADRWYPDDRPAVGSPRDAALLLIHGAADASVPVDHARRLHRAAGPGAELWIQPGVGHCAGYHADREGYVRRVGGFLVDALSR